MTAFEARWFAVKVNSVAMLALVIAIISLGVSVWAITGESSTRNSVATPSVATHVDVEATMTPCEVARQQLVDARTDEAAFYANRWMNNACAPQKQSSEEPTKLSAIEPASPAPVFSDEHRKLLESLGYLEPEPQR